MKASPAAVWQDPPMSTLLRLSAAIDALNAKVSRIVAWASLTMVLVGAGNALARYGGRFAGIDLASNAYLELQWYLFSLLFLLAAAGTLRENKHVRVDVFYGRLSDRGKGWVDFVGTLVFLIPFCVFILYGSWPSVAESWRVREVSADPGGLPRYPIKTLVPVAFALLLAQGFARAVLHVAELRGEASGADPS